MLSVLFPLSKRLNMMDVGCFVSYCFQTGSSGSFSETHKPPDRSAVFSGNRTFESCVSLYMITTDITICLFVCICYIDDHSTLQSPEPELLYYRVTEEISLNPEVASPDGRAVSDWYKILIVCYNVLYMSCEGIIVLYF